MIIPPMTLFCLLFLGLSLLSVWIRRNPRIWGSLLGASLLLAFTEGNLQWIGLAIVLGWALLWIYYVKNQRPLLQIVLFAALVTLSFGFKFHLFPGFRPVPITPKFHIGLGTSLMGLFPLALLVPTAKSWKDWKKVAGGLVIGCLGIAILAIVAVATGATQWQFKLPSFPIARYLSNLFLTAIPEEAFYRGFLQNRLSKYLENTRGGKWMALIVSSLIFTLAHIYWSPSLDVLGFVFLSSLLYGGVYLISGKIESAILCHFLLNFIHMTFFSYHAM